MNATLSKSLIAVGVILCGWPINPASAERPTTETKTIFQELDKDLDGKLTAKEYLPRKISMDKIISNWDKIDTDKNGQLSRAELEDWKLKLVADTVEIRGNIPNQGEPYMRAEALEADRRESEPGYAKSLGNDVLSESMPGLVLRRGFKSVTNRKLPGRILYTYDSKTSDSFYNLDAALGYYLEDTGDSPFRYVASLEAHTTGKQGAERDVIEARFQAETFQKNFGTLLSGYYQSDSKNDLSVAGIDLALPFYGGDIPYLGDGDPVFGNENIYFLWMPYVLAQYGHVFDPGDIAVLAAADDFIRIGARIEAELEFGDRFLLTASGNHLTEMTSFRNSYNYFEANAVIYLDRLRHFSLGLTYKNGEDPPQFKDQNNLGIWFGASLGTGPPKPSL